MARLLTKSMFGVRVFFLALEYKSSLGSVVCRESVIQTLEILFQNGLNLNRRCEDSTIWFRLMDIGHRMQFSTIEAYNFWKKILKSCVLHGPNLGQVCQGECNWFNVFLGNLNEFRWTPQLERTLRTFEIFLSYGVDPNMSVDGRTIWELLLQEIGTFSMLTTILSFQNSLYYFFVMVQIPTPRVSNCRYNVLIANKGLW